MVSFFPDFPGCVTCGKNVEEAFAMSKEALEFHIEGMCADNENVPEPTLVESIKDNPEYKDNYDILLIPVGTHIQSVRVDITMRSNILNRTDNYCRNHHITRSKYIEKLISQDLQRL